ncbi:hypothetical protein DL98DRAFT_525396 [Cadophora sp. DSE1049]|nr:hypothetical protein DL98DRAFT_525396 [Cadophora sp. DSE1049]
MSYFVYRDPHDSVDNDTFRLFLSRVPSSTRLKLTMKSRNLPSTRTPPRPLRGEAQHFPTACSQGVFFKCAVESPIELPITIKDCCHQHRGSKVVEGGRRQTPAKGMRARSVSKDEDGAGGERGAKIWQAIRKTVDNRVKMKTHNQSPPGIDNRNLIPVTMKTALKLRA